MDELPARTPEVEALVRDAEGHSLVGRVEEARKRYSEALRLAPRDLAVRDGLVRCTVQLGNAALDAGEVDRAISNFQLALELSPFHPGADAGLRRAAEASGKRESADPLGSVLEGLGPVRALRELQTADRVVAKITGTARPSAMIQGTLDARRAGLARQGAPPREHRIEHELAAAWRKRWFYRSLPVVIVTAALVLWAVTGAVEMLNWGVIIGAFAALWDYVFVERGSVSAERIRSRGG